MNNAYLQLGGPPEKPTGLALLPLAMQAFRRHALPLVSVFAFIAFAALALGMIRPDRYTSSTTILVEDRSTVAPLMDGAVPTESTNYAAIARELAFSRRVMNEILRSGGWLADQPSPIEQDRLIEDIKDRTQIDVSDRARPRTTDPSLNLIKISYTDSDPQRAYTVAKRFAELLMEESLAAKADESRDAYKFIDTEVKKYHRTLVDAEKRLQEYRTANPNALPGMDTENAAARVSELRGAIHSAQMDLADMSSQETQLRRALAGESEISGVSRNSRLLELQAERNRLLMNYTEQHPDVVRVQRQIEEVQRGGGPRGPIALGGTVTANPLHADLRRRLADVRAMSAAAASRAATGQALLNQELARSQQLVASEGTLAELLRDHEVNRDLYQDLLKRRENARVSMNLDAERRGLNFRIQEPAAVPLQPTGARLMHFAGAGLVIALAVPILLLLLLVRHDPRVRTPMQIERDAGLPVLGTIPAHLTRARQAQASRRYVLASALLLAVPAVYGLVLVLKLVNAL